MGDRISKIETETETCPKLTDIEEEYLRELIFERNKLTYCIENHFGAIMSKDNDKILLVGSGFENNCSVRCFVNGFVFKNEMPEEDDDFRPIGVSEKLRYPIFCMIRKLYYYMKKNGKKYYNFLW